MWEKILITGLIGLGIRSVRKDAKKAAAERQREEEELKLREEEQSQREELEKRRRNTPCYFNNGITQNEFNDIVQSTKKHIKRLISLTTEGPIVYGKVRSQSGISIWKFTLDFNDFGEITGAYWKTSENYDSDIPQLIGDSIQGAIQDLLTHRNIPAQADIESRAAASYVNEEGITAASELKQTQTKLPSRGRWKKLILLIIVVLSVSATALLTWRTNTMVTVGSSAKAMQGKDYITILEQLEHSGFTNVQLNELHDLLADEGEKEGTIESVTINGNPSFTQNDKYRRNSEIIISYHVMKQSSLPLSAQEFKGMDCEAAVQLLLEAGFTNVHFIADYDLLLGWISKENTVKSIAINANEKFTTDSIYRLDEEIVIHFHAFKRDKQ